MIVQAFEPGRGHEVAIGVERGGHAGRRGIDLQIVPQHALRGVVPRLEAQLVWLEEHRPREVILRRVVDRERAWRVGLRATPVGGWDGWPVGD